MNRPLPNGNYQITTIGLEPNRALDLSAANVVAVPAVDGNTGWTLTWNAAARDYTITRRANAAQFLQYHNTADINVGANGDVNAVQRWDIEVYLKFVEFHLSRLKHCLLFFSQYHLKPIGHLGVGMTFAGGGGSDVRPIATNQTSGAQIWAFALIP